MDDTGYSACFYEFERELTDEEVGEAVATVTSATPAEAVAYRRELRKAPEFRDELEAAMAKTEHRPTELQRSWRELVYALVRATEPETVVETGVFDGLSSAFLLRALAVNGHGELVSIDVAETELLPSDVSDAAVGWAVPSSLRDRWDLRIGDARELLPTVAATREIDLFLHDSNHERDHVEFELETIAPAMTADGVVVVDNVEYHDVFDEFAADHLREATRLVNAEKSPRRDAEDVESDKLGVGLIDE